MENMVNYNPFFKNKRILITGDTGFKGSWLAFWLHLMEADVLGFSLPPLVHEDHYNLLDLGKLIKHIDGNILDSKAVLKEIKEFQPEIVFHLAAQALVRFSYDEPKLTFDTNVGGSVNILEAIRKTESVRALIYVTSDKCYKNKEWIWGYRENDELGGHDPYSASKAAAEIVISSYINSFFNQNPNIGIASVRAGNVIGGGDWSNDRIIPDCIRSIMTNKAIEIRNPFAIRPWQHVLEPLSGYLKLAENLYKEPKLYTGSWNFGPSSNSIKTVNELSKTVVDCFGQGIVTVSEAEQKKHEAGLLLLNCDKANQKLNWTPKWNFIETVSITIDWYKKHLSGVDSRTITTENIQRYINE